MQPEERNKEQAGGIRAGGDKDCAHVAQASLRLTKKK